ncbi:sugar phosphate isomerase/epimerase family protein [Paractinoplanes brasiliensis]|uniref:Sugar phosphate isomerase/epimerase n=1 Tax=Paractinoplanes brasiliensis TaxID=52695 RepID=A0A4R6JK96_9ACTN|nr:sugar phosphate isomerase/epimerase [Actinoplanes brasiliensis]TDO36640.1 sugar phosphate isomerase/epimerase [Actinoplanes brasiliensis]GID33410.1 hypothetical protein Abr02nite_83930 [Actinoplanes brasiliensis]
MANQKQWFEEVTAPMTRLIFWPGSLGNRGFAAVLDAARAGGFSETAISPLTLDQMLTGGRSADSIREQAAERGVRLAEIDGVTSWAPIRYSAGMPARLRERFDLSASRILDLAQAAGADRILAAGAFERGAVGIDDLVASFASFADRAAERGLDVELEFVPFWGIPDLATAWEIVRRAERENGTLLIDTWHLLKASTDPEAALGLLPEIPGDRLTGLQLADALTTEPARSPLRCFPGEGDLPLGPLVRLLHDKGGLTHVGVEIFGEAIDGLDNAAAGIRTAAAARDTWALAQTPENS